MPPPAADELDLVRGWRQQDAAPVAELSQQTVFEQHEVGDDHVLHGCRPHLVGAGGQRHRHDERCRDRSDREPDDLVPEPLDAVGQRPAVALGAAELVLAP